MSKSNSFANAIQLLKYNNVAIANIGDVGGLQPSASAGSFFIKLCTTDPTNSAPGTEATYTGYARIAVARTTGGFTVAAENVSNAAIIQFAECTANGQTIVAFEIMTAITGGDRVEWGLLDSDLIVSPGSEPKFDIGELDSNED